MLIKHFLLINTFAVNVKNIHLEISVAIFNIFFYKNMNFLDFKSIDGKDFGLITLNFT